MNLIVSLLAVYKWKNVCWACDVPIDYSKPVKSFKEEVESVKVEKKAIKKVKNEK